MPGNTVLHFFFLIPFLCQAKILGPQICQCKPALDMYTAVINSTIQSETNNCGTITEDQGLGQFAEGLPPTLTP